MVRLPPFAQTHLAPYYHRPPEMSTAEHVRGMSGGIQQTGTRHAVPWKKVSLKIESNTPGFEGLLSIKCGPFFNIGIMLIYRLCEKRRNIERALIRLGNHNNPANKVDYNRPPECIRLSCQYA